jgi:hypothetical protein
MRQDERPWLIPAASAFTFAVVYAVAPVFGSDDRRESASAEPVAAVTPSVPSAPSQPKFVYFPNCDAARAAGAAPLGRGYPGYRSALDRDGDGIACEPYYGH